MDDMERFVLPEGYSWGDPNVSVQDVVPGGGYGGADVSQEFDMTGKHFVVCCANGPGDPSFRLRAFEKISPGVWREVPMPFLATGRGEQATQFYDGHDHVIGWNNNSFEFGKLQGFAPFPSIPSLDARIRSLENQLASVPPGTLPPVSASGAYVPVNVNGAPYVRIWKGQPVSGYVSIHPGLGPAVAYNARISAEGAIGGVARLGASSASETALTAELLAVQPGSSAAKGRESGQPNCAPDGSLMLWTEGSPTHPSKVWVDIYGVFRP